ncbi:DUF551 domain-containing protein [Pseudomonas aeruginosa]|nr:DUF551 domain-containing protein [Pseudomonas aeruginosa]
MSEWIDCKEELPEPDVPVLIDGSECAGVGVLGLTNHGLRWGFAKSGPYWDNRKGWIVDSYDYDMKAPSRWMSLPDLNA